MRVLVLVTDAFGGIGGIAKFDRDFLKALCEQSQVSEVVAIPRFQPSSAERLPNNLTYVRAGLNSKLKYVATLLKVICRDSAFDLIIIGHLNLLPLVFLARLFVRAPILVLLYGIEAWQPPSRLIRRWLQKVKGYISISELTRSRFCARSGIPPERVVLLPVSVDLDHFAPGPKNVELLKKYALSGRTVLMTLGRLDARERSKGFDEILEVLPGLAQQIPNVSYLIAGEGTDRKRLEEKAKSLGIGDRVIFTGYIPEAEKIEYYRLANAYVMPSRWEGFGIVFLEAMACGIPVVASKIDGSREAVREESWGILVDPDNREELRMGIIDALKLPRGVRPVGLDFFSYVNFEKRVHEIIDQFV